MSICIKNYGRLGNNFFQNIVASILSKKFDLKVLNYPDTTEHEKLGINYHNGNLDYSDKITVSDENLLEILKTDKLNFGLNIDGYFQLKEFVYNYKKEILSNFNLKYENDKNNDLFIHVRLGDTSHLNNGFNYYSKAIEHLNYENGYITSDSMNHDIVKSLVKKYNLIEYQNSPVETINFGKNFKNIILSRGTFSWWTGFLSKAESIIYPPQIEKWDGDIFVFDDWIKMDY